MPRGGSIRNYYDALASIVRGDGERSDGWANANTGFGTVYDRTQGAAFYADSWIDDWTAANLFHHNGVARRFVTILPNEALRRPPTLEGQDAEALQARFDHLDVVRKVRRGLYWGRNFGGGLGVMWVDDGRPPDQPVDPSKAYRVRDLTIYDKRSVQREALFDGSRTNGQDGLYAHAKQFRVSPAYGGEFLVHRDRCLVFGGVETGDFEREMLAGWDASVLQAVYAVLASFDSGYQALAHLLTDASQPVITIKGLAQGIGQKSGRDAITVRAQLMNLTRSMVRALFLDADGGEKFERVNAQFAGIPDSIDRLGNQLALVTEIPVSILMGQAPAGLGVTGDSDVRAWYNVVAAYQQDAVQPHFQRLIQIQAPGRGNKIKFPELWAPSGKESADERKAIAEADAIYLDQGVVTPEEVALSRNGPRDVRIDPRLRKRREMPSAAESTAATARNQITLAPTDLATVVRVNEARASAGLPPIAGGDVTLAEWKAQHATTIAAAANAEDGVSAVDPLAHQPNPIPSR